MPTITGHLFSELACALVEVRLPSCRDNYALAVSLGHTRVPAAECVFDAIDLVHFDERACRIRGRLESKREI